MEGSKTEQYTFAPNEQEILEVLAAFENELGGLPEGASLEYYENFEIKGIKELPISGVFLLKEQDENGEVISYSLYYQSPSNKILSIDKDGNMQIDQKWKEVIGDIDFGKTMNINEKEENIKGISRNPRLQEIQKRIKEKVEKEEVQQEDKEEKTESQIKRDIGEENDLGISYYRPIKDNNFNEQIGMNLNEYEEKGLAYSETENSFIMAGEKNGKFEQIDGFEKAKITYKKVMSIDEKGKKVENEVPHALMKINNENKELSITMGQYGYREVGIVDRLPCDERVKRQVGEQGETSEGRTVNAVNKAFRENGKEGVHKFADNLRKENIEQGETVECDVAEEISGKGNSMEGEKIPNTNIPWREFANNCGYRDVDGIEKAKEIFEKARNNPENEDKSNKELVEDIEKQVLEDSRGARDNISKR